MLAAKLEKAEKQFETFHTLFTEMKEQLGLDDLNEVVDRFIESYAVPISPCCSYEQVRLKVCTRVCVLMIQQRPDVLCSYGKCKRSIASSVPRAR